MLPVDLRTRRSSMRRRAIIDALGHHVTAAEEVVHSFEREGGSGRAAAHQLAHSRAASRPHSQVSSNAVICAWAFSPLFSANSTL